MERIAIIGTTGSGKSWLAARLAETYGLTRIELDDLKWNPGWQESPDEVFTSRVTSALQTARETAQNRYVISGNYSKVQPLYWSELTHVVFLDYAMPRVFWQLLKRSLTRTFTRQSVCNGNYETFRKTFLSSQSILIWFLQTFHKNRRKYLNRMHEARQTPQTPAWIHLTSPEQTQQWLTTQPNR